ncbi:MAG: permease [Firmicutes bacterium]|jgi:uncharacterized membrane protein YraQ (UPF0718 family)|nr:permease [Bacillota bacterium]
MVTGLIYGIVIISLGLSVVKDPSKSKKALLIGSRAFMKMLPALLAVTGLMGIISGALSPETISRYLGPESGYLAVVLAAIVGAITLIPHVVALPLAGSLYQAGAAPTAIAAFITTLNMVGIVTAPLEMEQLGKKYTVVRNVLSFVFALIIAFGIGVMLR